MQLKNDLISVIMPVYNVEKYVSEAICSILNQTYINFEFIIVDDYSTDNTFKVCEQFAQKDSRIKLFKNKENLRIEKTLNFALSKVTGKYVVRMDGDDISEPDRFEVMKNFLENNSDVVLCGTCTKTIDEDGSFINKVQQPSDFDVIKKMAFYKNPVLHIWMTYKRIYDELGGYRIFKGSEDYDFILRVVTKGYKIANIKNYFGYSVRVNRTSNTVSIYGLQRVKSSYYVIKLYKERLRNGTDSYSLENLMKKVKTGYLENKIFMFSSKHLYIALSNKSHKLKMIFHLILSCVSPYQIYYYMCKIKVMLLMKKDGGIK